MNITLNNAKGKILKTAKTVIREDIEVVPSLEKKNINSNGTYTVGDGYAGIGEVVVNVTGGGNNSWAGVFSDERTYFVGEVVYYEGGIYERTKYSTMVQLPTNTEYWKTLAIVVGGTKEIHANGTYNITDFASIKVLVPDENSWCGEYDSEVNYKENAIVVYRRMIYLCIKDIDNKQSPDNEEYWDLIYRGPSDATGSAGDILEGKVLYGNDGERLTGTMPNNGYREGDYFLELDVSKPSETLYGAYNGTAMINLEEKTITENGTYEASKGKVISKVTVAVEGEVIPEFTEVDDFAVFAEADGDGSLLVGYDVSQKVALPAGSPARLASLSDEDFIADNIRKGKNIFGLEGAFEGEGGGGAELNIAYGDTAPEDTSKLWVKTTQPSAVKVSSKLVYRGSGEAFETLTVTMPAILREYTSGVVGEKIYIIGGRTPSSSTVNTVYCFDTTTEMITLLSVRVPDERLYGGIGISVGTTIYIFGGVLYGGGNNYVIVFDTEAETISKTDITYYYSNGGGEWVNGTKIYTFKGSYPFPSYLDTETMTAGDDRSYNIPSDLYARTSAQIGDIVYLFGGCTQYYDNTASLTRIDKLNIKTKTCTELSVTLPKPVKYMGSAIVGSLIYLFGGIDASKAHQNTIYCFDTVTDTLSVVSSATIPEAIYGNQTVRATSSGIYIIGGNSTNDKVWKFTATLEALLDNGKVQIEPSLTNNTFNLINTDTAQVEIGVNKVYKGNADGIAEEVEASLHNGTSWVTI